MEDSKQKIKALLAEASEKIAEAEKIADESGEVFYWEGPEYGMGGSYRPEAYAGKWGESSGWLASSQSC